MDYYYRLLESITTGTDSSLILFFVIVAGLVLPLYWLILKDRKYSRQHEATKHDKYIEREREIIKVIRDISAVIAENTAVTATLKNILHEHGKDTNQSIGRIHERVDGVLSDTAEIKMMTQAILTLLNAMTGGMSSQRTAGGVGSGIGGSIGGGAQ